jgi:hypothetical protein
MTLRQSLIPAPGAAKQRCGARVRHRTAFAGSGWYRGTSVVVSMAVAAQAP